MRRTPPNETLTFLRTQDLWLSAQTKPWYVFSINVIVDIKNHQKRMSLYMGRYGLLLCANESYTNNLALGINFDNIAVYPGIKKNTYIKKK